MNRSTRAPQSILATMCLALVLAVLAVPAGAAGVHFTHESYTEFQKQLSAGQIHAVTFNKKAHSVHVTLNDGRHVLASYPSHEEPQLAAQIRAKGASVKIEKSKKAKTATHHTLRYIAGGIVVVVILVVLVVLLIGRRRALVEDDGEARSQQTPSGAPPPDSG
jgi:ATP-dependent Zn protease